MALGRFGALMDAAFFVFATGSFALAFGLYRAVCDAVISTASARLCRRYLVSPGRLPDGTGRDRGHYSLRRGVDLLSAHCGRDVPLRPAIS